jgi:putative transposase
MYIPKKDDAVRHVIPRIETLSPTQIESIAQKNLLISVMDDGNKAKEALEVVKRFYPNLKRTVRWAQKTYKKYKQQGVAVLVDNRYKNQNQNCVLTPEIKGITLSWWYARPAAEIKEIWRKVSEECKAINLTEPSYETIKNFLNGQSEANKLTRAGKIKVFDKQGRAVMRYDITTYANQRWQLDNSTLKIWTREWSDKLNEWVAIQLYITVLLDAHTRAIAGFILSSKSPDAWTTSLLLRKAILRKDNPDWLNHGIPEVIQPDRGRDFMSHAVHGSLGLLGIRRDPDPPYYPDRKGKIERFFLTLNSHLRILPGHKKAIGISKGAAAKNLSVLLTRNQLQTEIEHWIVKEYHERVHSETGRKPREHWEETVQLRMPESIEQLDSFLMKADKTRIVKNTGVRFKNKHYWSPELAHQYKQEVTVGYNPEDLDSILLYDAATGEYIGEAWVMSNKDSKYSIADIKTARNQVRKGLLERKRNYAREIEAEDRRMVREQNWKVARKKAVKETKKTPQHPVETAQKLRLTSRMEQLKKKHRS